jgi:hypothetical protein
MFARITPVRNRVTLAVRRVPCDRLRMSGNANRIRR